MKIFDLGEVQKSKCPNLWHDLLSAGQYNSGRIEVPDAQADAIMANCKRLHGFGDVVAIIAQPIATVSDKAFGTNLKGCGGCAGRQEALNRAVPFKGRLKVVLDGLNRLKKAVFGPRI